jgi:hypothetical protein
MTTAYVSRRRRKPGILLLRSIGKIRADPRPRGRGGASARPARRPAVPRARGRESVELPLQEAEGDALFERLVGYLDWNCRRSSVNQVSA